MNAVELCWETQKDWKIPPYLCLLAYSICPAGIITRLSYLLWRLNQVCAGVSRIKTPTEYFGLIALYVDGIEVITAEQERIDKKGKP